MKQTKVHESGRSSRAFPRFWAVKTDGNCDCAERGKMQMQMQMMQTPMPMQMQRFRTIGGGDGGGGKLADYRLLVVVDDINALTTDSSLFVIVSHICLYQRHIRLTRSLFSLLPFLPFPPSSFLDSTYSLSVLYIYQHVIAFSLSSPTFTPCSRRGSPIMACANSSRMSGKKMLLLESSNR